jgi:hypothetical protein
MGSFAKDFLLKVQMPRLDKDASRINDTSVRHFIGHGRSGAVTSKCGLLAASAIFAKAWPGLYDLLVHAIDALARRLENQFQIRARALDLKSRYGGDDVQNMRHMKLRACGSVSRLFEI